MKSKPAFFINLRVPSGALDVNLSPDKREIALANESNIIELFKVKLDAIYAPSRNSFTLPSTSFNSNSMQPSAFSYTSPSTISHGAIFALDRSALAVSSEKQLDDSSEVQWLTPDESQLLDAIAQSQRTDGSAAGASKRPSSDNETSYDDDDDTSALKRTRVVVDEDIIELQETPSSNQRLQQADQEHQAVLWNIDSKGIIAASSRHRQQDDNRIIASSSSVDNATPVSEESIFSAEDKLNRRVAKDDFTSMRIIGQFNLGFIIVELRGDLFILDQHACDEKFRSA
jgi:DNA mismatch repair ATPase MutL